MKYELKSVASMSVLVSSVPAVLFVLGILGGLLTFVIAPTQQMEPMNFMTRLLATGLFSLLYMVLMVGLLMVVSSMYNFFTETLGLRGLRINMEPLEDDEASDEAEGIEEEPAS